MADILTAALFLSFYCVVLAGIVLLAVKKTPLFLILLGAAAIVAALPLGFYLELGINGCCGAPSTGHEGLGLTLGALAGVLGVVSIYYGVKLRKKKR